MKNNALHTHWAISVVVLALCLLGCTTGNTGNEGAAPLTIDIDSTLQLPSEPLSNSSPSDSNLVHFFQQPAQFSMIKKELHFLQMGTCLDKKYMHPLADGEINYN